MLELWVGAMGSLETSSSCTHLPLTSTALFFESDADSAIMVWHTDVSFHPRAWNAVEDLKDTGESEL